MNSILVGCAVASLGVTSSERRIPVACVIDGGNGASYVLISATWRFVDTDASFSCLANTDTKAFAARAIGDACCDNSGGYDSESEQTGEGYVSLNGVLSSTATASMGPCWFGECTVPIPPYPAPGNSGYAFAEVRCPPTPYLQTTTAESKSSLGFYSWADPLTLFCLPPLPSSGSGSCLGNGYGIPRADAIFEMPPNATFVKDTTIVLHSFNCGSTQGIGPGNLPPVSQLIKEFRTGTYYRFQIVQLTTMADFAIAGFGHDGSLALAGYATGLNLTPIDSGAELSGSLTFSPAAGTTTLSSSTVTFGYLNRDINGDWVTNWNDVNQLRDTLGTSGADAEYFIGADHNLDGSVDLDDLSAFWPFFVANACFADITDVGNTGSGPDGQLTVDDTILFIQAFGDEEQGGDVCGIGGTSEPPDSQWTVDDVIAFFNAYGDGCP